MKPRFNFIEYLDILAVLPDLRIQLAYHFDIPENSPELAEPDQLFRLAQEVVYEGLRDEKLLDESRHRIYNEYSPKAIADALRYVVRHNSSSMGG